MVETLEQIARIVDSLEPLADATAGEPVRADEWNTVVESVVELARIVLARERTVEESLAADYALAIHEHRGAVDLGWMDPVTRDLLEGGRAQRADILSELGRARRDLDALRAETASLAESVAALERRLGMLDDRDFDRGQRLDRLGGAVDSIGEQEASITDLRRTFAQVDVRVGEALALREELIDENGQRIDLAALRSDVTRIGRLQENLRTSDGNVVQIRDFERRLAQVEERVETRPGGGTFPDLDAFRTELLEAATLQARGLLDPVRADLDALGGRLDSVRADVSGVTAQVAEQGAGLAAVRASTSTLPALTAQVTTLQNRLNAEQVRIDGLVTLPQRIGGIEARIGAVEPLVSRIPALERNVSTIVTTIDRLPVLEERITLLERVRGDIGELTTRLNDISTTATRALTLVEEQVPRLDLVEAGFSDQVRRLATVETQTRTNSESIRRLERPGGPIGGPIIVTPIRDDILRPGEPEGPS